MTLFSPLALTPALPLLPLAQGDIDYEIERREQDGIIEELLASPHTQVMFVRNGLVAVPQGSSRQPRMHLATVPGQYVARAYETLCQDLHVRIPAIFLGSYGTAADAGRVVALDLTALDLTALDSPFPDSSDSPDSPDSPVQPLPVDRFAALRADAQVLVEACSKFEWIDLRTFVPRASAREIGQATSAISVANWQDSQRYCPACAAPTAIIHAGWAQRCTNPDDGRELFPRVEPAVITAVVDHGDRLLLQHNSAWSNPLLYSVSAGFVEAGESLEHAVRRETLEETGIALGEVKYLGSQPWPYPGSLMMAFKAVANTTDIQVDGQETVDAQWVTRDEYRNALIMGRMEPPVKAAIARVMIEQWLGHAID